MATAIEMVAVEVWVLVDECGDYVASEDPDFLDVRWEEAIGEMPAAAVAKRLVKITLQVPKPRPVELTATVGAEPECGELKVV